jgi:SulP family sulfate permease
MSPLRAALERFTPHLRGTRRADVAPDLLAGLAIGALAVPQAVAYALVAGLPAEMGLAAAGLPALLAALFGSSRFMVTGPTNPTSLLLGVSVVAPALARGEDPIAAALATGLVAGVLLAGLGVLGFGRASRFLSDSVICGFNIGVGLLIALRYLPMLAGVEPPVHESSPLVPNVYWSLQAAWSALSSADPRALAAGVAVPALLFASRRIGPRFPAALFALGAVALAVHALGWASGADALPQVAPIAYGLPALHAPSGFDPAEVVPAALALALLITVQAMASARALEPAQGPALDADRELFSQGVANLSAALVGAQCTSGSLTRSLTSYLAGAHTRLAGVTAGALVMLFLPVLAPALERMPLAALAGLIVLTGLSAISPTQIRRAASTPGDAAVLVVTLAVTLWLDLVPAVYAGLLLSLALLVRRAGRLQMVELAHSGQRRLREVPIDARTGSTPAVLLHLEGDLNFAVAPELADRLKEISARGPEVLILRLKRSRHLDATVLEALRRVASDLSSRGASLVLCGLSEPLLALLQRTELGAVVGPGSLLPSGGRLFEGMERAIDLARERLRPRTEREIFRFESEDGGWQYEI